MEVFDVKYLSKALGVSTLCRLNNMKIKQQNRNNSSLLKQIKQNMGKVNEEKLYREWNRAF